MGNKTMQEIAAESVEEIDRCARAYGFEVGRGHPLVNRINCSPDNPFLDKNWKSLIKE